MVFDSNNSPNLISNSYHISNEQQLFTISEKIMKMLMNFVKMYIYPNLLVIVGLTIIIGFLVYRYIKHSEIKEKTHKKARVSYKPHNF